MKPKKINPEEIRKDFPLLEQTIYGKPLVYLDNAATTPKPVSVIGRMDVFSLNEYATVHRAVYTLSQRVTELYDQTRAQIQSFLNAESDKEIVFVRGTTEAINLVARSYGYKFLGEGDEIIISEIEHHSNILPWQQLCKDKGCALKVIPVSDAGELDLRAYKELLSRKTKFVSVGHISNALGTINPVREIIELAHQAGAKVLIDGAQAAPHLSVDVQNLDCDFYCFSGHKLYGPTGVGVLFGKYDILDAMDPYQFGGDMVETVTFEESTFVSPPIKFEAGTTAIVQVVGLGSAISYVLSLGLDSITAYEEELLLRATQKLSEIDGLTIIGQAKSKASIISFKLDGVHPHDIGTILDDEGIAIRVGHHCAQPTMKRFGVPATARASFSFFNTFRDIDKLVEGIHAVKSRLL